MSVHWGGRGAGHVSRWSIATTGAPSLALDFLSGTLDSRITFTRTTTATVTNSSGVIQSAAINEPRFDYDPVTLAPRGLLIEEARTNLVLYSDQFDNVYWTKSNTTITANATTSPDGTVNADKLVENTNTGNHSVTRGTTVNGTLAYTISFYAKAGERLRIEAGFWSSTQFIQGFDLTNGTLFTRTTGSNAPTSASITPVGNGWYRCVLTATPLVGSELRVYLNNGTSVSYTGDGTSGAFIWGAQLEAGAFATSYIPTVASTVIRNADNATMTGTNFSSWYNQPQGTFVANFTPDEGLTNNGSRVLSTTSGGVSNRVADVGITGANWINFNGTNSTVIGAASVTTVPQRIAVAYATANYGYVLNGGTVATDSTALVNSPTQISLGQLSSTGYLNGHLRTITYYNTRLLNSQLQTLTQ